MELRGELTIWSYDRQIATYGDATLTTFDDHIEVTYYVINPALKSKRKAIAYYPNTVVYRLVKFMEE